MRHPRTRRQKKRNAALKAAARAEQKDNSVIVLDLPKIFLTLAAKQPKQPRKQQRRIAKQPNQQRGSIFDGQTCEHLSRSNIQEAMAVSTPWTRQPPPFKPFRHPPAPRKAEAK